MKSMFGLVALLVLSCTLIIACTSTTSASDHASNTVGLAATNFAQSSITIKKGQSITLVNQTAIVHIITNGTWENNTQDPENEPGAPVVNILFSSQNQSLTVGPFTTAGTFHYYCSVHTGMNLTVVVN